MSKKEKFEKWIREEIKGWSGVVENMKKQKYPDYLTIHLKQRNIILYEYILKNFNKIYNGKEKIKSRSKEKAR